MLLYEIVNTHLSCMSSTSSFHYGTNPVNQCLCNFSTAASQKLVVSLSILPLNNFCCDRYCWFEALFDLFLRCLTGFFLPFFVHFDFEISCLQATLKWCQTAPNVTRVCTYLHDIHMYTHIQYMYIHISTLQSSSG